MAYQVILEPGVGQFREFESPRARTRIIFRGAFSCALTDLRKARKRELATLDENRRSVSAEPYAQKKNEGNNRGGGKDDTCDHGLYVQKLESRSVPKKKSLLVEERINQQSAARSASSMKQHKLICQLTYQHDRLHLAGKRLQQRRQEPQQQQSTPSSKESSRGKKTSNAYDAIRDECMPLTGFFRGYCRLLLRPSRGAA